MREPCKIARALVKIHGKIARALAILHVISATPFKNSKLTL